MDPSATAHPMKTSLCANEGASATLDLVRLTPLMEFPFLATRLSLYYDRRQTAERREVNDIALPGFAGEASLRRASGHQEPVRTFGPVADGAEAVPQYGGGTRFESGLANVKRLVLDAVSNLLRRNDHEPSGIRRRNLTV
jgi:hypothetical protein